MTLVLAFLGAQVLAVLSAAQRTGQGSVVLALEGITLAIVVPFLIWNWFVGFIVYNHHTNPSVRFFKKRSEWCFYEGQVKGSVHVVFPRSLGILLNEIMDHTVHHIDVKIPYYRLASAQRFLEERLGDDLVVEKWSLNSFPGTLHRCQLYDYDQHRWMTFSEAEHA